MLNHIIKFSVRNKLIIALFTLMWIVYGIYQLTQLPIDAVPDITNDQVQIITTAPSLGAEDVERLITFPIELAVSNIPGIKESRSLSRFGLSLITVVFEDGTDVYWARQQVTERLSQVDVNENANRPSLAPVTTGLGEIYQYVLKPKAGYEKTYTLADLRTIQDWFVRRQLLGTPGVADVSTFGGELKQYEVAVNPSKLKAMDLTISDVFTALRRNNQNTGGAYIEKGPSVLYIRSVGLTKSVEDVNNIVVRQVGGMPVLVSHVADVRTGSAVRYGALTMAGNGEVCGGIVMMIKGGNSSDVIKVVKERIEEIQTTLPAGLVIDPFLDRTKMVNNAISTVEHNLIEGALIVVMVLVLFLGNFRAGLIVASVIPLSMLFAVAMMNTFGVSGNLMSLGALDFGLIVDGAVIIVEAILHHLHSSRSYSNINRLSQDQMDQEVSSSAIRMMNAAVFGQIIILIVYLPILSLTGIEGKMFKPMAQTVAFAILGAFILSLTYVPMISSLAISKRLTYRPTWSDRVMVKLEAAYVKALRKSLTLSKTIVAATALLFAIAVVVFVRMGGEFIPQLEEGDFAVEMRLLVGTNLSTTISAMNRISDSLKAKYPEVEKIVCRVGSAEIPTDPMPIEGGDMIIVLKDKSQWTSASSFSELAGKMSVTVQDVLPGVTTGFQYPVQMRFNELMTGAKQDVVCKIFGEDLNTLATYAGVLGEITRTVDGTADLYIETVTGMPQIVIEFKRAEIARYGLEIESVNRTINAAFAGASAGKIYEGEKSFDLVVRVGSEGRKRTEDVRNLQLSTPQGQQIPLSEIADVKEINGPNQIQRENAHRRIIVGFNVRGRDVESIVRELQQKVNTELKMEPGYTITYGGAFENLTQAKERLTVAVPVALLLIFAMLYFAFSSFRDGALIYTAIPLSAIGGVFALSIRDLPFSISAGVGFIALFGVAVLNGIVLLSEFNRIKKEETMNDILELVIVGTRNRLRPVLMTAAVASLGFLPMAISNGAGAEVQRPLATVVIGGLLTATLLTLFVLPALYLLFNRRNNISINPVAAVIIVVVMTTTVAHAQQREYHPINLDNALRVASANNQSLESSRLALAAGEELESSAFDPAKSQVLADFGHTNSAYYDTKFGVTQTINFPTVYIYQSRFLATTTKVLKEDVKLNEIELRNAVTLVFYEYNAMKKRETLLAYADSIYRLFAQKSELRFRKGDANVLEKTAAESQRQQINSQVKLLRKDLQIALNQFNFLLQDTIRYSPDTTAQKFLSTSGNAADASIETYPLLRRAKLQSESQLRKWRLERSRLLPDLTFGYSNQSFQGTADYKGQEMQYNSRDRFEFFTAGISVPLLFGAQAARIRSAHLAWQATSSEASQIESDLKTQLSSLQTEVITVGDVLNYYETTGLENAQIIVTAANQQFSAGEIDYLQWVILINQSVTIQNEYINNLNAYNRAAIQLFKLTNN